MGCRFIDRLHPLIIETRWLLIKPLSGPPARPLGVDLHDCHRLMA